MKKFSNFKKNNLLKENVKEDNIEQKELAKESKSDVSTFLSKIFEARQMANVYHLKVKGEIGSDATHVALNSYYDDILDLLDTLVETYIGQYDVIEDYDIIDTKVSNDKETVEYFIELNSFIKENRYNSFQEEDSHLQNIIDEIVALTYRLIYKLRFTK